MADLGTSAGLQGTYQGDSAQNNPAYIKPKENKGGDMIIDFLDKEEKKKQAEQDAFDKQVSPFISVDGSKYLPHRVPLIQEQSQRILQEFIKAKRQGGGNALFNPDVQKELTKLQQLQSKYGREAAYTKEIATKLNGDDKYEYTEDFRKDVGKAIEGTIDPEKYISSEMADEAQTFYKYGTPKAQTDLFEFMTPEANKDVQITKMVNGNYITENVKGSEIYNTPEGQELQYQKFLQFTRNRQDPHAKYFIKEARKQINANDNLAFQQSLLSMTPLEAAEFEAQEAAKIMLERAMNTNKLKTVDKTTKVGSGFTFNNNFQSTAGGGARGKVFNIGDPIEETLYPTDNTTRKPMTDKEPIVKNGKYFSIQAVSGAENAPKVVLSGKKGAVVQGITRDEDTGIPMYAKVLIPEVKTKGRVRKGDEAREARVLLNETDISDIRTNIGADQYDATIGNWVKPTETKAAAPKTYKIGNKEWSADKVEKAAKASGMSVDEYIKEIQK